jgi:hypothetical protein
VDYRSRGSTREPQASSPFIANSNSSTTRKELLLYIAATTRVVSTAIVVEHPEEGHAYGVQRPVYFISEVLSESKVRYPSIQKLLYGILITSRKLRHYFDEYKISVITDFPLGIYSTIGMPLDESQSGQLNWEPWKLTSSQEQQSSHKH